MPRNVDENARRERVARAVWRVILRQGLPAATVRAVAQEAGLSVGALRHYFRSQTELRVYVFDLLNARAETRWMARREGGTAREQIEEAMWALLPVTEEQREEEQIRLEFLIAARTDPSLADVARQDQSQALELTTSAVSALIGSADERVPQLSRELFSLLHGVAQNAALFPEAFDGDVVRAVVRGWIDHHLTFRGDT